MFDKALHVSKSNIQTFNVLSRYFHISLHLLAIFQSLNSAISCLQTSTSHCFNSQLGSGWHISCVSMERAGVTDLWSDHVKMKSSWEKSLALI